MPPPWHGHPPSPLPTRRTPNRYFIGFIVSYLVYRLLFPSFWDRTAAPWRGTGANDSGNGVYGRGVVTSPLGRPSVPSRGDLEAGGLVDTV